MAKYNMKCPECGNWAEGQIERSFVNKTARTGIKGIIGGTSVLGAASTGAGIGATIGSVVPVIGTGIGAVIGGAIGVAGGAAINTGISQSVDAAADAIEGIMDMDYTFTCPNCGNQWKKKDQEILDLITSQEIEEIEVEDPDIEDTEEEDDKTYADLRKESCIQHYCMFLENLYYSENENLQSVTKRIKADTGLTLKKFSVKEKFDVFFNTFAFLSNEVDEDFNWYNLITLLPHGKNEDAFELDMYYCGVFDNIGSVLIGVIKSGCVAVGDKIAIYTKDGKQHEAEVTMVELFMKKLPSAESGDSLGLGVDIDLSDLLDDIVAVKAISTTEANTELTSEEQEYVDALKEYLSDGEISERERKMLDRVRKALGITEDRAAQLESALNQPTLSDDEKEYLEAYREYLVDGAIDEKSRKRLDIFRKGLGLSEDRAKEIEQMA